MGKEVVYGIFNIRHLIDWYFLLRMVGKDGCCFIVVDTDTCYRVQSYERTVVFCPMMIGMAPESVIMPELTNPTSITVVADEL